MLSHSAPSLVGAFRSQSFLHSGRISPPSSFFLAQSRQGPMTEGFTDFYCAAHLSRPGALMQIKISVLSALVDTFVGHNTSPPPRPSKRRKGAFVLSLARPRHAQCSPLSCFATALISLFLRSSFYRSSSARARTLSTLFCFLSVVFLRVGLFLLASRQRHTRFLRAAAISTPEKRKRNSSASGVPDANCSPVILGSTEPRNKPIRTRVKAALFPRQSAGIATR